MYNPCWRPPKNCHCILFQRPFGSFLLHVYLTHTRKICYNNANNNTHISIFCDRHVCHSSLTSFGTLLQVYAHTRYNFYIEYAIMQEREERERERERNWEYKWMQLFSEYVNINFFRIRTRMRICHKNICCYYWWVN